VDSGLAQPRLSGGFWGPWIPAGYPVAITRLCCQSLRRLWVAVISRHSALQAPQASSLELVDPSVVLGLGEHGLDHRLSLPVERFAFVGG
jgi:hypothetical protein